VTTLPFFGSVVYLDLELPALESRQHSAKLLPGHCFSDDYQQGLFALGFIIPGETSSYHKIIADRQPAVLFNDVMPRKSSLDLAP
jgi:hypothetical protein